MRATLAEERDKLLTKASEQALTIAKYQVAYREVIRERDNLRAHIEHARCPRCGEWVRDFPDKFCCAPTPSLQENDKGRREG